VTRRLGEMLGSLGGRRPFVVTDPGVLGAGLLEEGLASLKAAGVEPIVFSETEADPPEQLVLHAAAQASAAGVDSIIGFGGGSSMDIAKLVAVLSEPSCTQPLSDMYGVGNVRASRLPLVQVPTTAGTGSEVTPISIITTGVAEKKGVVSPQLLPDLAMLDGDLLTSLPPHVAAATGIDSMVHAIEAYTSVPKKNMLSDLLAREALTLLGGNIRAICHPDAVGVRTEELASARSAMMLGSCYAGMAFANAPVAAVHALAYPLGSHYHVPHGLSNSLVLPHVLDFNAVDPTALEQYAELAPLMKPSLASSSGSAAKVRGLVEHLHTLPHELGLPTRLSQVGVPDDAIAKLASEAMKQTRLLPNNPRLVSESDAVSLYQAAL